MFIIEVKSLDNNRPIGGYFSWEFPPSRKFSLYNHLGQ